MNNKTLEAEAKALEEFFGVDLDTPEVESTYTIPRAEGEDLQEIKINPFIPFLGGHESRHSYHFQIIEEVVDGNEEEVIEYYEEELHNLETGNSFYEKTIDAVNRVLDGDGSGEIYRDLDPEETDASRVAEMLFSENALTDQQVEVFANNSDNWFTATRACGSAFLGLGATAVLSKYLQTMDLNPLEPEFLEEASNAISAYPDVAAVGLGVPALLGGVSYLLGKDAYETVRCESLTQDNLEDYGKEDRRRALLYNSKVDDSIDDFLETLDEYGIK